jgi:hypothetical protein
MKITQEQIEELNPCTAGFDWYLQNKNEDLLQLLLNVNKTNPSWARWLFTNLMDKRQNVEIAIYSAELVLHTFENKYPNDLRPRKALEAAKDYLKTKSAVADADSSTASYTASYAAAAASYVAAYASYVADAAAYAADAAYAASYVADAAAYAAYAASYAAYATVHAAYATDAVHAAYATAYATNADAAAYAAYTADAAYAACARLETQEKIIIKAVEILEGK